jgi:3D (Asp-Asp-Asp) domain-containing protein
MIAADLSIRPRGSLVPTSLGMGIVCDTGTFIYTNPTQIDIAVAW